MRLLYVAFLCFFVACVGTANATISSLSETRYQVFYGDIESVEHGLDGYPDILLKARKNFVMLGASVAFPVPVDSGYQDILLCGSGNGTFSHCTLAPGAMPPTTPTDQFDLILADFDGSGAPDIFLHARNQNDVSLVLGNQQNGRFLIVDQFIDIGGHRISGVEVLLTRRYGSAAQTVFSFPGGDYAELDTHGFAVRARWVDGGGDGSLLGLPLSPALVGVTQGEAGVSHSGAFQYSLPIPLPPGVNDHQPRLSVQYNSSLSKGNLGAGANLAGLSTLARCGPTLASGDAYTARIALSNQDKLCLDGVRLILVEGSYWAAGSEYRLENGGNRRVMQQGSGENAHYILSHPDGREDTYALAFSPSGSDAPLLWAISDARDAFGNVIYYEYDQAQTGFLPRFIRYGHNDDVVVEVVSEPHNDGRSGYIGGGYFENHHALSLIKVTVAGQNAFEYRFGYGTNPYSENGRLTLNTVQQCGFEQGSRQCAPPTRLDWSERRFGLDISNAQSWQNKPSAIVASVAIDWDGDGRNEVIMADNQAVYGWLGGNDRTTLYTPPSGFEVYSVGRGRRLASGAQSLLVNVGRVDTSTGRWHVRWHEIALNSNTRTIESLSGNLSQSIARLMNPYRAAKPLALDYQGNGYTDFLLWYPNGWRLYSSNGSDTANYSRTNIVSTAALPVDAQPFVADVSGDGFPDVVYKRNTQNEYRRVRIERSGNVSTLATLQDAGGTPIDARRTVWGDVNGDGLVDIVSGHGVEIAIYFNMGNGKFQKRALDIPSTTFFIESDSFETVRPDQYYIQALDYSGDGRDDLVFYNPQAAGADFKVALSQGDSFGPPETTQVTSWLRPSIGQVSYSYRVEQPRPETALISRATLQQILRYALHTVSSQIRINYADGTLSGQAEVFYSGASNCSAWMLPPHLNCQLSNGNVFLTFDLRDAHHYWSYNTNYIDVDGTLVPLLSQWLGQMQQRGEPGGLIPVLPWGWPSQVYSLSAAGQIIENCLSGGSQYTAACNFLAQWAGLNMTAGFYLYRYGPSNSTTLSGHIQVPLNMADWLHADLNGDGAIDMVAPGSTPDTLVMYENRYQAPLVTGLIDPLGAQTRIAYGYGDALDYQHDQDAPALDGAFHYAPSGPLVSRLTAPNGQNGVVTEYQYRHSLLDRSGRGWLGFSTVKTSNLTSGLITRKSLQQAWPYTGRVAESESRVFASDTLLSSQLTQWASVDMGGKVQHVYPQVVLHSAFNDDGGLLSVGRTEKTMDVFNGQVFQLTEQRDETFSGLAADGTPLDKTSEERISYQYSHRLNDGLLGFVESREVEYSRTEGGDSASRVVRETFTPDGQSNNVRTHRIYNGAVSPENLYQTITHGYSARGVRTLTSIAAINAQGELETRTERAQGLMRGRFPAREINAMGYGDQANRSYDFRFAALTRITDANGLHTSHDYDPLGRQRTTIHPDGSETSVHYSACTGQDCAEMLGAAYYVSQTTTHPLSAVDGSPATYTFYDELGREVGTEQVGYDGRLIRTRQGYDPLGRLLAVETPHYQGETGALTTYSYDVLGRPLDVHDASGTITRHRYSATPGVGLKTEQITELSSDSGGQQQVKRLDQYNRLGERIMSVDDAEGEQVRTSYRYDAQGNRIYARVNDDNALVTSRTFDLMGNLLSVNDPSQGVVSYQYSGFGEVSLHSQANGTQRRFTYDLLGRKVQEEALLPSAEQEHRYWVYDLDADNQCDPSGSRIYGGLACRLGVGFQEQRSYDALARLQQQQLVLADGASGQRHYTQHYQYDAYGRLSAWTAPNGYAVHHSYNPYGYFSAFLDDSGRELYRIAEQDAWQNPARTERADGVIAQTNNHQSATGRFVSRISQANGTVLQDDSYQWWSHGQLQARQQLTEAGPLMETFGYDGLHRLISAQSSGAASRSEAVSYDASGNILSKSGVGDYHYQAAQPHAVSHAAGQGYQYDASGNMIQRGAVSVHYNALGKPTRFTENGSDRLRFAYGPDYGRYYQWRPTDNGAEAVFYLEGYEEVVSQSGVQQRVYVGDAVVIQREQAADDTLTTGEHYLLRDHLGSVHAIADGEGQLLERLLYDPWGQPRSASGGDGGAGPVIHDRGFTDHEHLSTLGLIHMNGRVYDPHLGRFLSPDPVVQAPYFSQNYNRYSYVLNGPLSLIDPTGYMTVGELLEDSIMRNIVLGNHATAYGLTVVDAGWMFFGFESLSKTSDTLFNDRDDYTWGDAGWTAVEVLTLGKGEAIVAGAAWGFRNVKTAFDGLANVRLVPNNGLQRLDPTEVSFSQSWVSGQKAGADYNFDSLVQSMRTNGWQGNPVDVVIMRDGALTSIDNTRVLVARHAGIEIQANVHRFDDLITDPVRQSTLTVNGVVPKNWGDATLLRINKPAQNHYSPGWSERFPNGSLYDPNVR